MPHPLQRDEDGYGGGPSSVVILKTAKLLDGCDRGGTALQGWNKVVWELAQQAQFKALFSSWGSALFGLRLCCASPEPQRIGAGIKAASRGRATTGASLGGFGNLAGYIPHYQLRPGLLAADATIEQWMPSWHTPFPLLLGVQQLPVPLTAAPGWLALDHTTARVLTRAGSSASWVCNFFAAVPGC